MFSQASVKKLYFEYVGNIEKFVEYILKIYTSIFFGRTKRSKNTESSGVLKLDTVLSKLSMCFSSLHRSHQLLNATAATWLLETFKFTATIKLREEVKYINLPPFLDSIGSAVNC